MENRAYAIATGAFVLILAAALFAAAFWLSGGAPKGVPYDLITEVSVAGLENGAPVRLRGIEVGQVRSIGFDPADQRRVRVRILVDPSARLLEGTHATLSYIGLSSTAFIELDYPDSAVRTLQTSLANPTRIPLTASGLAQLTEVGNEVLQTFKGTLQRVNGVLTPQTSRDIAALTAHLNDAAASLALLTHDLQPAARRADHAIGSADALLQALRVTAHDADTLLVDLPAAGGPLDAVRDGAHSAGQAARDLDAALLHETLPRIDLLAERLTRASDSLNETLRQIRSEPRSLIFGSPAPQPGPGEPGFRATAEK
jgi:phospholipid/cholesterol/gamma-HCH transport system substrate-binding protein